MTGVMPVYEPDGRVFLQTWVSYADARREALRTNSDLIVLVDVDDATRRRVAESAAAASGGRAIVCTPTRDEAYKFGGPGVYAYRFDAYRGGLYGGREGATRATPRQPVGRRCVNGRCS